MWGINWLLSLHLKRIGSIRQIKYCRRLSPSEIKEKATSLWYSLKRNTFKMCSFDESVLYLFLSNWDKFVNICSKNFCIESEALYITCRPWIEIECVMSSTPINLKFFLFWPFGTFSMKTCMIQKWTII